MVGGGLHHHSRMHQYVIVKTQAQARSLSASLVKASEGLVQNQLKCTETKLHELV